MPSGFIAHSQPPRRRWLKTCLVAQVVDVIGKKVLVAEADGQVSSLAVPRVSYTSHFGRPLCSALFEIEPSVAGLPCFRRSVCVNEISSLSVPCPSLGAPLCRCTRCPTSART